MTATNRSSSAGSSLAAYGAAALSIILATGARLMLDGLLGDHLPFVTYFVAVMFTAWFAGWGPSLVAMGLGFLTATYFFVPPRGSFAVSGLANQIGLALYFFVGIASALLSESQRRASRRAEASARKLLDGEARLARTEAFSLVMVTHVGLDGRWLKVPQTLCRLLGYSEAELLSGRFKDVTHPDDFEEDWRQCQRLIRGEIQSFDLEKRYIRKDGGIVWVYLNCSVVTDEEGTPVHFVTYIRDITERKKAEEGLRRLTAELEQRVAERTEQIQATNRNLEREIAERKRAETVLRESTARGLRQVAALVALAKRDAMPDGDVSAALRHITETSAKALGVARVSVWRCTSACTVLQCADLYELGADRHSSGSELRASDYPGYFRALSESDVIAASDAHTDPRTREFSRGYLTPLGIGAMMDATIRLDGVAKGVVCHEHVGPARQWTQDEQAFAVAIANQVALAFQEWERKRLEEKQAQLVEILESTPDFVAMASPDGRVLYMNRAGRKLVGLEAADVGGLRITDEDHPLRHSDVLQKGLTEAERDGRWSGETVLPTQDGREISMSQVILAHKDAKGAVTFFSTIARDITARKRAEAALLQTQEQLQLALNSGRVGLWTWNLKTNEVYFSASWKALVGYAEEELPNRFEEFESRLHPEDRSRVLQGIKIRIENPLVGYEEEFRLRHRDESYRWMFTRSSVNKDADGRPILMSGTIQDITERKQAEEELSQSREMLRQIIDNIPQQIFWKDLNLNYIGCNSLFAQSAGVGAPAAIVGKTDFDLSWKDKAETYRADDRSVMDSKTPKLNFEEPLPRPDGSVLTIHTSKVPLIDQEGRVFGVLGIFADITERKQAEEQIRLVTSALDVAANGVVITDASGTIQWVNQAFTTLTGYRAADAVGQNPRILKSDKQDRCFYQQLWDTINGGGVWQGELVNKRKDGALYTEAMTVSPVRNLTGAISHFVAIKEDITERKQMEVQVRQLERLTALGQLLGGIAHELKNPLFIMAGSLQIAREKLQKKEYDGLPASCEKMHETVKRLTAIAERFLHLAAPVSAHQARCAVPALLQETLDLMRDELTKNRINVQVFYAPDLPETWSDSGQLSEVFLSLIMNAVQAMAEAHGKGTLTVRVQLVTDAGTRGHGDAEQARHGDAEKGQRGDTEITASVAEGDWIEVRIQDDGPGISPKHRAKLFEPFFTTKPPDKGTGLGLWIVRSNLMMLHGTVRVESEEGQGATFIVRLPVVPAPSLPADPPLAGTSQTSDRDRKGRP